MRSAAGATIRRLPDGSFLAEGPRPEKDIYHVMGVVPCDHVTAIRLELMADPSLPQSGPGRADNGNCHLNHLRVFQVKEGTESELPVICAQADFNQQDWEVDKAIDGNPNTAWGIHPQEGIVSRGRVRSAGSRTPGDRDHAASRVASSSRRIPSDREVANSGDRSSASHFRPSSRAGRAITAILQTDPELRSVTQRVALATLFS